MYPFRKVFIAGLVIAIIGWGGLFVLFQFTVPTLGPRWLFFFFFFLGLSGVALPVSTFLNRRFTSTPVASASVIIRQSIWFGIYGCLLAWLQLGRVLNTFLGIALLVGFLLIEFFLRLREKSHWMPDIGQHE